MHRLKILIVDRQYKIEEALNGFLGNKNLVIHHVADAREAITTLKESQIDLALVNLNDYNINTEVLHRLNRDFPETDAVFFDETGEREHLFSSFDSGNFVYISKPFNWSELSKRIFQSRSYQNFQKKLDQLDQNFRKLKEIIGERGGCKLIGASPALKTLASLILMVAESDDTSVLITGESGTGKELVARAIHLAGNRFKHPFHAVNCSAIPESLFESEFFGYHKGAFTGATEKSTGWFESSDNGTLFLDEVTDLSLCMQSKFLRVLDDKKISRIGSHQEISVNLRIISASNVDFIPLLSRQSFREDLYHRLNSFHIHIPPLRERKEDIPVIIDHFISEISSRLKKPKNDVCPYAIEKLTDYSFPGNVRELRNMVERAVILAQNQKLKLHHFCIENGGKTTLGINPCSERSSTLIEVEMHAIADALQKTHNNKSKAAAILSISRQALDRKIVKWNIPIPA